MRAETKPWLELAGDDLKMASVLLDSGHVRGSLFHSHEAIEKLMKAMWVERHGTQAEKTHNLLYLAELLELDMSRDQEEFLKKLNWQLIPSRYPEGEAPGDDAIRWYHEQTRGLYEWLRQQLT